MKVLLAVSVVFCSLLQTAFCQDDGWYEWMEWTTCSVTCGPGYHVRSRVCDEDRNCTGINHETKPCSMPHCPVDGEWGMWSQWTKCSLTCSTGVQFRLRQCNNPAPQYGGLACNGTRQEFSKCLVKECPIDGGWTNWSGFGSCSETCGYHSRKQRMRNCTNPPPQYGGEQCNGTSTDTDSCGYVDCKDGTWETWAEWGRCTTTCGRSVHFRFRNCSTSANNGTCAGKEFESGLCQTPCPVDGDWSSWLAWGTCSVSCESGTHTRLRLCANPAPNFGGKNCSGNDFESKPCQVLTYCPIDGGWNNWFAWSACDRSCDTGHQIRIRQCTSPKPQYNGLTCPDKDIETKECNTEQCPVAGGWSTWFGWSSCSVSCGNGITNRFRTCTNPKPAHGGVYCEGSLEETTQCNVSPELTNCTLDGGWSSWGQWGVCSVSCGDGQKTRIRNCTNPEPHGEGKPCVGDSNEQTLCTVPVACPVNGGWSTWRDWFPCSASCGNGTQTRIRTCSNPRPEHGGEYCGGEVDENRPCQSSTPCNSDSGFVG